MPLELVSVRECENKFENTVLNALVGCQIDGIVTNNVVIPHVKHRNLPNEHDILVITNDRVYTIDAKDLWPGLYRGAANGQWEHAVKPNDPDLRYNFSPCTFMVHPSVIALKKRNVVVEFLNEKLGRSKVPDVLSVIVVPDEADISQLNRGENGEIETGARMYFVQKSELARTLEHDVAAYPSGHRVSYLDLAEAFQVRTSKPSTHLPCLLNEHVRLTSVVETLYRPFLRRVYRGQYLREKIEARIEITPPHMMTIDADKGFRAFRNNIAALKRIRHDGVLQHLADYDTPTGLVSVTEWFSDQTLKSLYIGKRALTWEEARTVFRPVVGVLRAAHTGEITIIHRHLDPSCIFIRESEGRPIGAKVGGFFGAVVGPLSTTGTGPGGNQYLDPDAKGIYKNSPLQDYYAVGRCLAAALGATLDEPVTPPRSGPSELAAVMAQLTSRDPAARVAGWSRLAGLLGS